MTDAFFPIRLEKFIRVIEYGVEVRECSADDTSAMGEILREDRHKALSLQDDSVSTVETFLTMTFLTMKGR